jgi:hypothetical protein
MSEILTSDQFVAGIVATLALRDQRQFVLADTELDARFEEAFERLVESERNLKITPNFTFYVDKIHKDSTCLRNTLIAAKDKGLIALNNPTFHTFTVMLTTDRAESYLNKNPLPRDFFDEIVTRYFPKSGD